MTDIIKTVAVIIIVLILAFVTVYIIGQIRKSGTDDVLKAQAEAARAQWLAQAIRELFAGLAELWESVAMSLPLLIVSLIALTTSLGSFVALIIILAHRRRPRRILEDWQEVDL